MILKHLWKTSHAPIAILPMAPSLPCYAEGVWDDGGQLIEIAPPSDPEVQPFIRFPGAEPLLSHDEKLALLPKAGEIRVRALPGKPLLRLLFWDLPRRQRIVFAVAERDTRLRAKARQHRWNRRYARAAFMAGTIRSGKQSSNGTIKATTQAEASGVTRLVDQGRIDVSVATLLKSHSVCSGPVSLRASPRGPWYSW